MKKAGVVMIVLLALSLAVCAQTVPTPGPGGGLFFDVLPRTIDGRVMVPLRAVFEWVGARVDYEGGRIAAYDSVGQMPRVVLEIGRTEAELSGQPYQIDVPPLVIEGRTFVPLRFVAESFGVWVDARGRTVTLQMPQYNLKADMAIPPAEGSHQAKIWKVVSDWYMTQPSPRVDGMRVLEDQTDIAAGRATVDIMARWEQGAVTRDTFALQLARDGWHITNRTSQRVN